MRNIIKFPKTKLNKICKTVSNSSTYASNDNSYSLNNNQRNHKLFLDYTFQENKSKLFENKENLINNSKIKNYYYEIKKTFLLNIDLILYFYTNKQNEKESNKDENNKKELDIINILNDIKNKESQKKEIKLLIKQKIKNLKIKYENYFTYEKKYQTQINIYNTKLQNNINLLSKKNIYINELKNRFSFVDKYIIKLRFISDGKKGLKQRNKLSKFISSNNKNLIKMKKNSEKIKKLKEEISEIKKDNKLSRRQNRLFKDQNMNIDLIRVYEFYVRVIRTISLKNKILKNSINNLCKTLEFLDLYQIKEFIQYKRTRQKSSYEIEFSDLENNYYEENKNYDKDKNKYCINNISKNFDKFMDFSQIFNI